MIIKLPATQVNNKHMCWKEKEKEVGKKKVCDYRRGQHDSLYISYLLKAEFAWIFERQFLSVARLCTKRMGAMENICCFVPASKYLLASLLERASVKAACRGAT